MLKLQFPKPVKFICGFIYSTEKSYQQVKSILESKFGKVDFETQPIDFTFTDYYEEEMGKNLKRRFISFRKLQNPKRFTTIKLFCLKLEKKFALNNKRQINIDPGYLNEAKLVLTTTKDFSHRIYLDKGIYAEITLLFKDGAFCNLETTFPDYRTKTYKGIFHLIRDTYRQNLKNEY
ncbi:MAG: DUF4416 family protein [Candidatus Omnitrophica bacterium]|nr:DUF4416 family protein [Candidatus Omnitrophota bacterium]